MGFLAGVRALFGQRPPSLTTPPTSAEGLSGVTNQQGRIIREPIAELRDQEAYGRAGTYQWGFWENLSAANPFVAQALDFVTEPIADVLIDIEPPPQGIIPDKLATEMTEFVKWNLTDFFKLGTHAEAAARGFLRSGFATYEPLFVEVLQGAWAGRWALNALEDRLPQSLHDSPWVVDEHGRLIAIKQQGSVGMGGVWTTPTLEAHRIIHYTWGRVGDNWAGQSVFRPVHYIAGKVMPTLLKIVGVTLQREGAGIPTVTAVDKDAKLTPEQRSELVKLLANATFHENINAVMPAGWKLDWIFSQGANKGHVLDIWRQLGVVVLQTCGAQQMALGTSDTGSRSVGETHNARGAVKPRKVLRNIESVLNGDSRETFTGLIPRLCRFNWGEQAAYPKVKLTMMRSELSAKEMADAAVSAKSAGLLTPRLEDENALRERMSLPPITEEERAKMLQPAAAGVPPEGVAPTDGVPVVEKAQDTALNGAQVQAATDLMQRVVDGQLPFEAALEAMVTFFNIPIERARKLMQALKTFEPEKAEPVAPPPVAPGDAQTSPRGGGDVKEPVTASAQRTAWKPWRTLRASEEKVKLSAIDEYFTRQREDFAARVKPIVVGMLAKSASAIDAAMADGDPSEVAALPFETTRLDKFIRDFLAAARATGAAFAREELTDQVKLVAAEGDEQDEQQEREDDRQTVVDEADEVMEAQAKATSRRIQNRLRGEIEREAIDTLRTGGDAGEVVSRVVDRQVDTGAFKGDAGSVTTKVFNVGRDEAARLMGGVAEVELTAILDSETCEVCVALDGTTAPFNSPEHDRLVPPVRDCKGGDNCRCLLLFIPAKDGDE